MTTQADLATAIAAAQKAVNDANTYVNASKGTPTYWYAIQMLFDNTATLQALQAISTDVNPPPPTTLVVASIPQQSLTVGAPFSLTVKVSGGTTPYAFLTHTMPPGLNINATSGLISGTPTTSGTEQMIFTVMDAGSPAQEVTPTVNVVVAPAVTPPPPPPGTKPPLGIYGNGGSIGNANSVAKQLGVAAGGVSMYCDGSSYASIGGSTWAKGDAGNLPMFLGVNLVPNGGNLSQIPANIGVFTALAKVFTAGDIARPGWEWDGNWFAWCIGKGGSAPSSNTVALLIAGYRAVVLAMRAANPLIKFDWCSNAGSSTLAQLQAAYPGDDVVDYIGADHYDAGSIAANVAAMTPIIQMCSAHNKPLSIGEWGAASNGTDSAAFIDFMAMLILNPALFSKTYGLPTYNVGYTSLFTDSDNNIQNKPNMIKEFPVAFAPYKAA